MSKVNIQTLTPIHIGSGNFLRHNTDFVAWKESAGNYIGIVDPRKVLDLIGVDEIGNWVSMIELGKDTKEFVKQKSGCDSPKLYSTRFFKNNANVQPNDTLKECIHDGLGRAYIPGSSIKGAIRTAVLATLSKGEYGLEQQVCRMGRNGRASVTAKHIESKLFGNDPNSDIFRFLLVGDAYFKHGSEMSTRLINLNIREKQNLVDKSKSQIVEAISSNCYSEAQIKINLGYNIWASSKWLLNAKSTLGNLPKEMSDLESLFTLINKHTQNLLCDEIELWNEVQEFGCIGAEGYIDKLCDIQKVINSCINGKECVLRLGHASGWRFITGAWAENLKNFESDVVPASRPGNFKYKDYDFPKSRRLDEASNVFGFIKLSLG